MLAGAGFALQAASTAIQFVAAQEQAKAQRRFVQQQMQVQANYRYEVMKFQNDVWAQDLAHAEEVLSYGRAEFDKQAEWAGRAMEAVEQNRNADAFTLMVRGIEETIAATFQTTNAQRAGQAARARFAAQYRGVEGNSTEAVLGDIWRQEGDLTTMAEVNRKSTLDQLEREGGAADAQADQQLSQIASAIRTFAPQAPIRPPGPVPRINPTAPVVGPSGVTLVAGLSNAAISSVSLYNNLSGQNMQQTMNQLSTWTGNQFNIGGTRQPVSSAPLAPGVG